MRRSHSGQASVLLVALVASLVACFAVSYSAGQLVNDKMRLVNAADAAAYSAAVWEARSLNFQSYMNRAIVANEVALAQLVSLRSWSRYVSTAAGNGARVAQYIPPLAAPIRALAQGWRAVDATLQSTLPALEASLSLWNVAVLANAQSVSHQQAPIVAADLVGEVARRNEPRAQVTTATRLLEVRNAAEWQNRFNKNFAIVRMEWQTPVRGLALYVDGGLGDNHFRYLVGGVRYYFGGSKTLKDRHRKDDPDNINNVFSVTDGGGVAGSSSAPPSSPPPPQVKVPQT